eukprot:GEMP01084899.1.p1 GENE.GEMP01084899.1~~GEMP01084899.1.p1  ORF type:complete len:162 (+),score=20.45 GEMP01084899.1:59-487(+)
MSLDALEANLLECDRPFVKVYGVITLLLLAWKSSTFTYIRWAVVWEVTAVLLLWFLNFLRHFFARAATSIRKDPNTVEPVFGSGTACMLLVAPIMTIYAFFLKRQYYVLWIDKALARTGYAVLVRLTEDEGIPRRTKNTPLL